MSTWRELSTGGVNTHLNGRSAKCMLGCPYEVVSSTLLPHFEFMGTGSYYAENICGVCHMHRTAHVLDDLPKRTPLACDDFTPVGPAEFDAFLCCGEA